MEDLNFTHACVYSTKSTERGTCMCEKKKWRGLAKCRETVEKKDGGDWITDCWTAVGKLEFM